MRNRTKKCIVLLLAILLLCLCVWRLTPRTFGQMTGADPQTISSLSGTAVLGGNRDGTPYMESYTLPTSTAGDEAFRDILSLLCQSGYREDLRNLLPWAVDSAGRGSAYAGRSVTLILIWGTSADETCSLVMTGGQIVVGLPNHDGFLIYHLLDTTLLDQLTEYLMTHGEKG